MQLLQCTRRLSLSLPFSLWDIASVSAAYPVTWGLLLKFSRLRPAEKTQRAG